MLTSNTAFNAAKADFNDVYDQPDPREYFAAMKRVGYRLPENVMPSFLRVIEAVRRVRGGASLTILDVGCSYGINGALLNYELTLDDLYGCAEQREGDPGREPAEIDRKFFATRKTPFGHRVHGVDRAAFAIGYATSAGLIDQGAALDLEAAESPELPAGLADVDLIISTGCVGYVTVKTFARLLDANTGRLPWIATSALRTLDYSSFERFFGERGYVTSSSVRPVKQRAITSETERAQTLSNLAALGKDPAGFESEGDLYADCYVSMPAEEAGSVTREELFG
ncbi:class I SAM-dependent methyltransferase [Amycolatopsis samaneae]|uniref:Class I SAM-dependent methyltransferase n=1 Tax=Amycolatopsis samaneae TaxID=664691 RepID=A0ABW5GHW7_9PSEU